MPRANNFTGKQLNELWGVGAKHALYSVEGKWYHLLNEFPGALFDSNGYVVFETYEEYIQSPYLKIGQEINVPGGISKIPSYVLVSENAQLQHLSQKIKKVSDGQKAYKTGKPPKSLDLKIPQGQYNLERNIFQTELIIRDTKVSAWVKYIHEYRCQICGLRLEIGENQYYAEAHHVKPLGNGHNGPDVVENVLCVCPNHHALLDLGAINIDAHTIHNVEGHRINIDYILYHNTAICKN